MIKNYKNAKIFFFFSLEGHAEVTSGTWTNSMML